MLTQHSAIATAAVRDMKAARRFYEGTLGLRPSAEYGPGAVTYGTGQSQLMVYQSQFAGANQATAVTWIVGDGLADIVRTLAGKGVVFEHYDNLPETKREGDIHISGRIRNAWFKDPDGNVHALASG
jgi:catechol 2,3-dioxygenase-like lactoylglutathione lyase family enzyme